MHPELFTLFFRPYAVPSPPDCFSPEAAASRLHLLRRDQLAPLRPAPRVHRSQLRIAPRGPTFASPPAAPPSTYLRRYVCPGSHSLVIGRNAADNGLVDGRKASELLHYLMATSMGPGSGQLRPPYR